MKRVKGISAAGWFYQQSFVSGGLHLPEKVNPEDAKQPKDKPPHTEHCLDMQRRGYDCVCGTDL